MKKTLALLTICAVMFVCCTSSFAASNPAEKLSRGVANVITAPIEIAKQIDIEWKESAKQGSTRNVTVGIFGGLVKGLAFSVGRAASGVWDIVSFPFKVPANYEPVMKPDFVLDK